MTRSYFTNSESAIKVMNENDYAQVMNFSNEDIDLIYFVNRGTCAIAILKVWKSDRFRKEDNTLVRMYHERAEAERSFRLEVENEMSGLY